MFIKSLYGCFKAKKNLTTHEEEIYRTKIHPEVYLANERANRREKIAEAVGGIVFFLLLAISATVMQVIYGIW